MQVESAIQVGKGSVFFLLAVEAAIGTAFVVVGLFPVSIAAPLLALAVGLLVIFALGSRSKRHFDEARAIERGEIRVERPVTAPDAYVE